MIHKMANNGSAPYKIQFIKHAYVCFNEISHDAANYTLEFLLEI